MEELPETLKAEIEALDSLDARALKRRYADIVADMPKCALSSVLRATIAWYTPSSPPVCKSGGGPSEPPEPDL